MTITFGDLLADTDWVPMPLANQQNNPSYFWNDGGLLGDSPADFDKTFGENMSVSRAPIQISRFNRNPLRVVPGFTVPRHHHNMDEKLFVLAGEYHIEHYESGEPEVVVVRAGEVFLSRAGTPYTMTAGPEGVTYIETWPRPLKELKTYWHDFGWVHR